MRYALLVLAATAMLAGCVAVPEVNADATSAKETASAPAAQARRSTSDATTVSTDAFERMPKSYGGMPRGAAVH